MKVVDSNRYYLPGTGAEYLHLATVEDGFRRYICFYRRDGHRIYVEEMTSGQLEQIKGEQQWLDVYLFLVHKGVLKEPFISHEKPKISVSIPGVRFKAP